MISSKIALDILKLFCIEWNRISLDFKVYNHMKLQSQCSNANLRTINVNNMQILKKQTLSFLFMYIPQ